VLRVEKLRVLDLPALSFAVPAGECLAIVGPSGSGKTILLRAIADLLETAGDVTLEGLRREELSGPAWRKRVRFAAAEPAWWAETPRKHFAPEHLARAGPMCEALGLQRMILDRPISELSTGERQRLALVRALADRPMVLLADEPTAALDAEATFRVEAVLRAELRARMILILVSHDAAQLDRLAHARLELGVVPATAGRTP
jgi:ABC-type iron transport system FetAB ATPase subunit